MSKPPQTVNWRLGLDEAATGEVIGFRDVNGNDFAIDADGNVTTTPLDFSRLMKTTEKR